MRRGRFTREWTFMPYEGTTPFTMFTPPPPWSRESAHKSNKSHRVSRASHIKIRLSHEQPHYERKIKHGKSTGQVPLTAFPTPFST